jgi:hypothetical protein
VLISVKPAFGFRNLLNRRLRVGVDSFDEGLLTCLDTRIDGRNIEEGLDSQGPPERFVPHRELETFRCRVQPSAAPWQLEPHIDSNAGEVLTGVVPLRDNSQQCGSNIATTAAHTRSCHAMGWPLTDPSQLINLHQSTA